MERNANYALVGFASLMIFVGMVAFVVWLARISFAQQYDVYDVVFQGPVDGLSKGSEVHFNGIKVGDIVDIGLVKDNPTQVDARVRVTSDVPIRDDSVATAEPEGITGVSYIQITPGTPSRPLLKTLAHEGKYPIIHGQPGALSALLAGGGTVLTSAAEALSRVNRILSDQNIQNFSTTLGDVKSVADEARKEKQLFADLDKSIKDIDTASASIKQLSDNANGLMTGDGKTAVHNIADAAAELKGATTDARKMLDKLQGPTTDFANNGLPQLTAAVASLRETADSLNRLSNELEQSPQGVLSKGPDKEVQVKP
ncbi:MAG TPA: MlaD family protein [Caulobacteraceae bacterium]|nr:MlaD family protein [Caulobacteraceae bacterium]